MKIARINPLYKKGNINKCENYRPISVLPIFSKITEKLINFQIMDYLERNNILDSNQFGFRKGIGTRDAIISFTNKTFQAFNKGNCVLGIFIDFSKAFDTIDHDILLLKLKSIGFKSTAIKWIENYLKDRSQRTKINTTLSAPQTIKCGVPQGSVLGSTLFLIYINDLACQLKVLSPILYADDTNLFFESKDLHKQMHSINEDLKILQSWCNQNKLTINFNKTCYILLKNPQNSYHFDEQSLLINGHAINKSDNIKFLGVLIDPQLNWSNHISKLLKDFRPYAGLFFRLSQYLSKDVLLILYNSFINSKLSYCVEAWGNAPDCYLNKIKVFQNRLLRIINKKAYDFSANPLFNLNRILTIKKLYKYKVLIKAHNTFYKTNNNRTITHLTTRQTHINLKIPLFKSKAGQCCLDYQESLLWNRLPVTLRKIVNANSFKNELKRYLRQPDD